MTESPLILLSTRGRRPRANLFSSSQGALQHRPRVRLRIAILHDHGSRERKPAGLGPGTGGPPRARDDDGALGDDERAVRRRAELLLVHEVEEDARRREDHARCEDGALPDADAFVDPGSSAHEDFVLDDDRDRAHRLADAAPRRAPGGSGGGGGGVWRARRRRGPASLDSSTPSRNAARMPFLTTAFA